MASADLKFISREEVSTHKNENDYWIIIHDKVYDVTKFLKEVIFIFLYIDFFTFKLYTIYIYI